MQGLVDLAGQIGQAFAIVLPTFCYIASLSLFLVAGWGFWRQAHPDNPFRGKPWVPWVALLLCGVFASFDRFLTMANRSGGSSIAVSVANLSSYSPTTAPTGLGSTPANSVLIIVQTFQGFFQAFGAMMAFLAVYAFWSTVAGTSRRSAGGCFVQFVFAVLLINVQTISQWLVGFFA